MEENLQEQQKESCCLTENKKCLTKVIIIGIICCLVCFFFGYFCGSRANNRAPRRIVNRPGIVNPAMQQRRLPRRPQPVNPRIQQLPKAPVIPSKYKNNIKQAPKNAPMKSQSKTQK